MHMQKHKPQTTQYVARRKKSLKPSYPDVASSHLSEALAAGMGANTNIGLLTELDRHEIIPPLLLDHEKVKTHLWELGYVNYAPMSVTRLHDYEVPCPDGAPGCWGIVDRSVAGLPELDSEQLLEIRDGNAVTLTAVYVDEHEIPVTNEEKKELKAEGSIRRSAYFNRDSCVCGSCGSDG